MAYFQRRRAVYKAITSGGKHPQGVKRSQVHSSRKSITELTGKEKDRKGGMMKGFDSWTKEAIKDTQLLVSKIQ